MRNYQGKCERIRWYLLNQTPSHNKSFILSYPHAAQTQQVGSGTDQRGLRGKQDQRHPVEHLHPGTRVFPLRGRTVRDLVQARKLPLQGASRLHQDPDLPPQRRQAGTDLRRHARDWRQVGSHQETHQSHGQDQVTPHRAQPRNPHERRGCTGLQEQHLGSQGQANDPPIRQGRMMDITTLHIPLFYLFHRTMFQWLIVGVLVSYGVVWAGLWFYCFIMNLLDQLFQYSLRSESSSISFSALDNEQNMELSSISLRSLTQATVSPSMAIITPSHEDNKNTILALNSQQSGISVGQMETYMRVKDKYRKLSKMVEMFGNKIRKIQYEFLVKLENRCKNDFNFKTAHHKQYAQYTKEQIMKEISKDISVFVCQKISPIHAKKQKELLRHGFDSILKRSLLRQRLEYFGFSLKSLIRHKIQSNIRLFFNILKQKRVVLARNTPKSIHIQSKRMISVKQEIPIQASFNDRQRTTTKISVVHPQRRQTQNIDIGDNLNIILLMNQEIFYIRASLSETLQASILKTSSEIQFKTSKKRSELTNASGSVSQVEECVKFPTQCGLDEKFAYEVPLFELSQSACFKQKPQQCLITYQIAEQDEEFSQFQQLNEQTKRFSLQDHQDDLNRYIIFRRSIEKKRDSTLKDIQKSKQTIKRIVYELQKSKTKNEKQKIRLASKKPSFNTKSSERKIPVTQSKASSPTRSKTIGIKSSRASPSKKCLYDWQVNMFSTRDNQNSENHIIDELQELQTPSRNMEVYYNYLKAKRKSMKLDDCSHKKGSDKACKQGLISKNQGQHNPGKKCNTSKHQSGPGSLLVITKDSALRERRIDVKVDLTKPITSGRTKVENVKGMAKKGRK